MKAYETPDNLTGGVMSSVVKIINKRNRNSHLPFIPYRPVPMKLCPQRRPDMIMAGPVFERAKEKSVDFLQWALSNRSDDQF